CARSGGVVSTTTPIDPILSPTPLASPTPLPLDSGWQPVGSGVEYRWQRLVVQGSSLSIIRLDPQFVRFRVVYEPTQPRLVSKWFTSIHPLMVVNGGFFTDKFQATGLLVSDGVPHGRSYQSFGGMF